ncbi:MAG: glycosyltransferase family 4 protein [Flavobacteriaceae bacterium]|jgi:glycosyltransferase involved in cell wall biosynthesis|nr:glycosyltransferase family 4 protein [Flavobacteriaceae bacterium]
MLKKIILMSAYDINPYKGSESGTGWNFVLQAASYNRVIAITRKNNKPNIEKYIEEFGIEISNITFHYYDLPYYLRFWKRGARGSSIYFYLWQMFMPLFVKNNNIRFDLAHNVNFHADAFPSFLWILRKPVIWGPINHNEKIPKEYINFKKEYLKDRLKWIVKFINWNYDPFMYLAKKKSDLIIGGNSSVQKRLGIAESKFIQLTQVASNKPYKGLGKMSSHQFNVLMVGRFLTIKSFDLGIYSFDNFWSELEREERKNVKLTIIGQGPMESYLKEIVAGLASKENIEFIAWVDKDKIDAFYKMASVFLFPSHEGAGMVVIEALSNGLPVICFNNVGPGEFVDDSCAIKIAYSNYEKSISDYSTAILKLYLDKNLHCKLSNGALDIFEKKYTWDCKGLALKNIYNELDKKSTNV